MTSGEDMTATKPAQTDNQDMIARIVAAYAQRSDVGIADIVRLTQELRASLGAVALPAATPVAEVTALALPATRTPAISLDDAVSETEVRCLCCGKGFKTLKRHLHAAHGLSEDAYRAAFGLSPDFPIVAPAYSERRSQVASDSGFGTYDRGTRGAA